MPLYAFEIVNRETGETVAHFDLPLPVAQRDELEVRRAALPDRIGLTGMAENPNRSHTLRALHRVEQRMGNGREFYSRLQLDPNKPQTPKALAETYKQAWAQPPPPNSD